QQKVALASVPAFFRSHLGNGNDPAFNQNFNPLDMLPDIVTRITQIDRDFTATPAASEISVLEDFDKETGTNSSGNANLSGQISIKHYKIISQENTQRDNIISQEHPQRAADITWEAAGLGTFFEAVIANQGRDLSGYATLDIRIGRKSDPLNKES